MVFHRWRPSSWSFDICPLPLLSCGVIWGALTSAAPEEASRGAAGPSQSVRGLLCVCASLRLCRHTGCQIHICRGGKPCHSHLLWFRSPHILSCILSHPASAAAALSIFFSFFLCSKTPKVIFSSTSHTFYLKPCISRKRWCATVFFPGLFLRAKPKT